jgi:hypothetical protein
MVRFQNRKRESSICSSVRNFSGITQFAESEISPLFPCFLTNVGQIDFAHVRQTGTFGFPVRHLLDDEEATTTKSERAARRTAGVAGFGRRRVFRGDVCEHASMSVLTKPITPDRSKIDMHNSRHVKAWARKLNVSPAQLQKVVETVGNSAAEVRKEISRSAS